MTNDDKCGATIRMGDDYGDNVCTFRCKLRLDHNGEHVEAGNMYGKHPYNLSWWGDMRDTCPHCKKLVDENGYCKVCHTEVCRECFGECKTYDDESCPWCKINMPSAEERAKKLEDLKTKYDEDHKSDAYQDHYDWLGKLFDERRDNGHPVPRREK